MNTLKFIKRSIFGFFFIQIAKINFGFKIKILNLLLALFLYQLKIEKDKSIYKIVDSKDEIYISNIYRLEKYFEGIRFRLDTLHDEYFLNQINFEEEDKIIDVGSNIGELAFYFCNKRVHFFAFEPSPSVNEALVYNLDMISSSFLSYSIFDFPLSDIGKETTYFLNDNFGDSSLENKKGSIEIKKTTKRLDQLITAKSKIKLLKIDAEGYELEVLKGSSLLLDYIEYIAVDAGFEKNNDSESTLAEVLKFLNSNNFKLISDHRNRKTYLFKNKCIKN
jgi:FkbM family methyltransferase